MNDITNIKAISMRILAVFAASALGVVGAGAIAGVPLYEAYPMAGIGGMSTVIEELARAYIDDGKLDTKEINSVFEKTE